MAKRKIKNPGKKQFWVILIMMTFWLNLVKGSKR